MDFINYLVQLFLHLDEQLVSIISQYGTWTYAILFMIIFMETGFVVTPFLPGDSLLFAAGSFAAPGPLQALNIWVLLILLSIAAVLGDTVNYWIGHYLGDRAYNVKWVKKEYLDRTHAFFEKHGGKTIFLARFVPIVRTFAPFVAASTPHASGSITKGGSLAKVPSTIAQPESSAPQSTSAVGPNQGDSIFDGRQQPARTPHSLGPLLKFDPQFHRRITMVFLLINCDDPGSNQSIFNRATMFGSLAFGFSVETSANNVPTTSGSKSNAASNIEISNMEIAGWGGQAIQVLDEGDDENQPANGPGQEQPNNLHGERIGRPEQVRIFHNYIHHNQHPRTLEDSHALGYGVDVHHGAWAQVYENVFDFNRHAIAAAGDTGGYEALRNLVLKGGGIHVRNVQYTYASVRHPR